MNDINDFRFYVNYYRLIKLLPSKKQATIYKAILEYMFEDKEPSFDKNSDEEAVWTSICMGLSKTKSKIIAGKNGGTSKPKSEAKDEAKGKAKDETKGKGNNISYFLFLFSNLYISNLNNKDNIYKLFKEYLELRTKNKYTVTETVVKRLINKLNEYGTTDEKKIKVIENAINGAWKDFYPLKNNETEESIDDREKRIFGDN